MSGSDPLVLSASLDRARLAQEFAQHRRIQVRDVLTASGALRLRTCLENETVFNLVVNSGEKVFDLPPSEQNKMTPENKEALRRAADHGAGSGFQFIYENHRMTEVGEPYRDASHFLAKTVAFLNGPEFLGFARDVTGLSGIRRADAQATRYGPGHFLTAHDDDVSGKNRLVAYVLNLTATWQADWGGLLLFLDDKKNVSAGFTPVFNALNLLAVPQQHLVSQVSTFARGARYAITGWLRS